jgi:aspartyl-tRNA(Asn)/glutamyl-tRNA(Gln) amidotransferase subunit C
MSILTREEVLRIAKLARLDLTPEEVALYQQRLARVLDYIHELNSVETPKEAFVRHIPKDAVAFREDRALPFTSQKLLLDNAPKTESNSFLLPTIVEHS